MTKTYDIAGIVDRYFAAFAVPDSERPAVLEALFAEGAYYCDPQTEATDTPARMAMAANLQKLFPGATVLRSSAIDHHHRQLRFNWVMVDANGQPLADGIDVLFFNDEEKVTHAFGFFGHSPADMAIT